MKRLLSVIVFIVTFITFISCGDSILGGKVKMGDPMQYNISFVFQDAEGNDLSDRIDIKDWYPANVSKEDATFGEVADYKLDIILSDPGELFNNKLYNINDPEAVELDYNPPMLVYQYTEDNIYLGNNFLLYTGIVGPQDKLTYEITCPHIFGDNEVHVITTYWKEELGEKMSATYFPECYKVEFDGKVITDIGYDLEDKIYRRNYVTLTIDR